MNSKVYEFKNYIKNKKVAVLGIGISNTPLIRYLSALGVDITAFDMAEKEQINQSLDILENCNVKYCLGKDYLEGLRGFDVIFKTPKVRFDIPELAAEEKRGALVTSEMEVFLELCPAKVFAVTGSDGKTTTTTLIYNMLKKEGYTCWLGGNIGNPLLDRIDEIKETDMVVVELSSFQLQTMKTSPQISVVTNLSPNHLDVHKSFEEYIDAKKNIFKFQSSKDKLVLNYDNSITREFASEAKGNVEFFSRVKNLEKGALLNGGALVHRSKEGEKLIVDVEDILLPGNHNIENYLAAISAVIEYVKPETIYNVALAFGGVEHRIEFVRELKGIKFYNSSIDSSPSRTMAALNSFKEKVILIAGGKDKNIPYEEMGATLVEKVKGLLLIGPTGAKIEKAFRDEAKRGDKGIDIPILHCSTYKEVVEKAYSMAVPGDVVILSPASTSFDMFKNFEERGNKYKEIVRSLQ